MREREEVKKQREEVKREREDKAEIKRAVQVSLRFIRDEQDWSGNTSPKISWNKTKKAIGNLGISLDKKTPEQVRS